jgi:fructose-1,6-bisphosphatase/sedoheptulose 1,7-bisphosphatase-like protein
MVRETSYGGLKLPIYLDHVAIPTNEKSYRLEIYESQIQNLNALYTKLRLTVTEMTSCRFQRPIHQRHVSTPEKEKLSPFDCDRL